MPGRRTTPSALLPLRPPLRPRILLVDVVGELGAWWGTARDRLRRRQPGQSRRAEHDRAGGLRRGRLLRPEHPELPRHRGRDARRRGRRGRARRRRTRRASSAAAWKSPTTPTELGQPGPGAGRQPARRHRPDTGLLAAWSRKPCPRHGRLHRGLTRSRRREPSSCPRPSRPCKEHRRTARSRRRGTRDPRPVARSPVSAYNGPFAWSDNAHGCQGPLSFTTGGSSVAQGKFLFTSEAVSMGHPDKLADQISDGMLDALFAQDPYQPRGLRDDGHHRHGHRGRRDHHQGRDRLSPRSSAR